MLNEQTQEQHVYQEWRDRVSEILGASMLRGHCMLASHCPKCPGGIPMMRDREKNEYCVACRECPFPTKEDESDKSSSINNAGEEQQSAEFSTALDLLQSQLTRTSDQDSGKKSTGAASSKASDAEITDDTMQTWIADLRKAYTNDSGAMDVVPESGATSRPPTTHIDAVAHAAATAGVLRTVGSASEEQLLQQQHQHLLQTPPTPLQYATTNSGNAVFAGRPPTPPQVATTLQVRYAAHLAAQTLSAKLHNASELLSHSVNLQESLELIQVISACGVGLQNLQQLLH